MTEPNVLRLFLGSAFVPPEGANRGRVHDAGARRAPRRGRPRGATRDARRPSTRASRRASATQMHWIPLWYEDQVAVTSARARAFVPSAEGRWLGLAALP